MSTRFKAAVSLAVVTTLGGMTTASAATAATPVSSPIVKLSDSPVVDVPQEQIDQFAVYLENGGGLALEKGQLGPDVQAVEIAYGAEESKKFIADWNARVADIMKAGNSHATAYNFTHCILSYAGLGGLGAVSNELQRLIQKHAWRKVAEVGLKEAAKRGVKVVFKGGVAGMAASLAVGVAYCSTFG